jgi:hypothetical protein
MYRWIAICLMMTATPLSAAFGVTPQVDEHRGSLCRGVMSAYAAGKTWFYVWARLNADGTADTWRAPGPKVDAELVPLMPPSSADHLRSRRILQFPGFLSIQIMSINGWNDQLFLDFASQTMTKNYQRQTVAMVCTQLQ